MKFDWENIKAYLILWTKFITVFKVRYLPFKALINTHLNDQYWKQK